MVLYLSRVLVAENSKLPGDSFLTIIILDNFLIWRHIKFSPIFYSAGCKLSEHQELVRPDMPDRS